MDRRVGGLGQRLISRRRQEHVGGFAGDLELVKVVVLKDLDVIETGFHHRLGTWLAVFLQQVLFERSRIHANADRTSMIAGSLDDLADALFRPDVARVDPQTGRSGFGCFDGAFVVEMYVGHDGHGTFCHDRFQRRC